MTADAKKCPTGSNHRSVFSLSLLLCAAELATILIALLPAVALAAGVAVTKPANKVHHTTAVLSGHLDPEGDPGVTECHFEWGETAAYGNTVPCAQGSTFNAPADVSAVLGGLKPDVTYHFRLRIETTSSGPFTGADQSFTTIPVPTEHPLIASFGKDGTSGSSFGGSGASPAIDHTARKLYVADSAGQSGQIYGFDASGPPAFPPLGGFPISTLGSNESFMQVAVDNTGLGSAGNIYFVTVDTSQVPNKYKLNGINPSGAALPGFPIDPGVNPGPPVAEKPAPGIEPPIGPVAVSSTGEIWIAVQFSSLPYERILKYSSAGVFLGSFDITFPLGGGAPKRIVFDSDDNFYVALWVGSDSIWKFSAASGYISGTELPEPPSGVVGLAFDPSTEYVYASTASGDVAVYDALSGELFDEFDGGGAVALPLTPPTRPSTSATIKRSMPTPPAPPFCPRPSPPDRPARSPAVKPH